MQNNLLKWMKALAEESRMRLIVLLSEGGERPVNELALLMDQSQPRVSHHLRVLSEAGIIERRNEGAFVFYRLSHDSGGIFARNLLETNQDFFEFEKDMRALEQHIEAQNSKATTYFDQHAEEWHYLRSVQINETALHQALKQLVVPHAPVEHLLDIGTGTGDMLTLLSDQIKNGEGIDLSRHMLDLARARLSGKGAYHCRVRLGDMHRMHYEANQFNMVIMNMVLHFSDHPERAIKEAVRVLAPKGHLIFTDFIPHSHEEYRLQQTHSRLGFDKKTICDLFEQAGLVLDHSETIDGLPESSQLSIYLMLFHSI